MKMTKDILAAVAAGGLAASAMAADGTWLGRDGVGTSGLNWTDWNTTENWRGGVVASGSESTAGLAEAAGRYVNLPGELSIRRLQNDDATDRPVVLRGDGVLSLCLYDTFTGLSGCWIYSPYVMQVPSAWNRAAIYYSSFCGPCLRADNGANVNWFGMSSFRFDKYAPAAGGHREETAWGGDFYMDGSYGGTTIKFWAPRGSGEAIVAQWSQTEGSPFLGRASGQVEHVLSVGTGVSGEGIPEGAFLKRVFPDGTIELSAAATSTIASNALRFEAFVVDMTATVAGRARAFNGTGAHNLIVQKYREEDSFVVELAGLVVQDGGEENARWKIRCDDGMVPGVLRLKDGLGGGADHGVVTLENSHLELGGGNFSGLSFAVPSAEHTARIGVGAGLVQTAGFDAMAGTLVKTMPGRLVARIAEGNLTGAVVVEEGELAVSGVNRLPVVTVKSDAALGIPEAGLTIGKLIAEKGAVLRGCGRVVVESVEGCALDEVILEGAMIHDPEVSSDPLSVKVLSGAWHVAREGEDTIFVFDRNATVKVTGSGVADVLVVGGGGGGGYKWGGGGGGGGVVYRQGVTLRNGRYGILIGRGGSGAQDAGSLPADGGDSQAFGLCAIGGGAGGTYRGSDICWPDRPSELITVGRPGGSGGGGGVWYPQGASSDRGGAGQEGQGHDGGRSRVGDDCLDSCGGGGGGAGAPGTAATYAHGVTDGGCGGSGRLCAIYGERHYGGGGGGGGAWDSMSATAGLGGLGGGGDGGRASPYEGGPTAGAPGKDGIDGLGGGGGGGSAVSKSDTGHAKCRGGRGGDGVVILRFRQELPSERQLPEMPVASGGELKCRRGHAIHTFRTDGLFALEQDAFVDMLIVGGGGGGGTVAGGGGGAGGVVVVSNVFLQAGEYPVMVGMGGAGAASSIGAAASEGGDSSVGGGDVPLFGMVAVGGGRGGTMSGDETHPKPTAGGSGGGAGSPLWAFRGATWPGAAGTDGQGFGGGASTNDVSPGVTDADRYGRGAGGGGGGAAGPGAAAPNLGRGGDGGNGVLCDFSGEPAYYGGGGGGGSSYVGWMAAGGLGGGGGGGGATVRDGGNPTATAGENGVDGLGGGGGGAGGYIWSCGLGGKGGDGIVIIRYRLQKKGMVIVIR